jgi:hypothetical protein
MGFGFNGVAKIELNQSQPSDPFCTSFGGKKIKIHVVVPGNTIVADYEEPDFQHKLSL